MADIRDRNGRCIDYARISVTDRCNYRCVYCMPEEGVSYISHKDIMRYEEILFLCNILDELGVRKIRFTGGEPLLRKGLVPFLKEFRTTLPNMAISLTTNASMLSGYAEALSAVGLSGLNISLDTLDPVKFHSVTRNGDIKDVLSGITAARDAGILNIKTNTVLIRGFNDDELHDILNYTWNVGVIPRFIEFMPLGDDVWKSDKFISAVEILNMLSESGNWVLQQKTAERGDAIPLGPARYYTDNRTGRSVGIIEAVSNHFCDSCNRLRITASGVMMACLFSTNGVPLLELIRNKEKNRIKSAILSGINMKPDWWEETRDGKQQMSGIGG